VKLIGWTVSRPDAPIFTASGVFVSDSTAGRDRLVVVSVHRLGARPGQCGPPDALARADEPELVADVEASMRRRRRWSRSCRLP
jgi:hypothetical protein